MGDGMKILTETEYQALHTRIAELEKDKARKDLLETWLLKKPARRRKKQCKWLCQTSHCANP